MTGALPASVMADTNATWILHALERYETSLLRYGARLLGDRERAKDVVQETFLELCKLKREDEIEALAPWLFRVCRNRALDIRRKDRRVQPLSETQSQAMESPQPSPQDVLEHSQGASSLLGHVKKLPESQQEVVFLRFHAGLSYKEIAKVTGHSVSNVGVLIHTAIRSIRQTMLKKPAVVLEGAQ